MREYGVDIFEGVPYNRRSVQSMSTPMFHVKQYKLSCQLLTPNSSLLTNERVF